MTMRMMIMKSPVTLETTFTAGESVSAVCNEWVFADIWTTTNLKTAPGVTMDYTPDNFQG